MNRVTTTAVCVRTAAMGVGCLLMVCHPVSGAELGLSLEDTDAIVVAQGAALYDGPAAGAKRVGELAPGSRLELESRGLTDVRFDENFCTIRWSIMTAEGRRWVDGAALAVRQSVPTMRGTAAALDQQPFARDGASVPDLAWFGYQRRDEWSEQSGCERPEESGWLFTSRNGTVTSASLTYTSDWGTGQQLEQHEWIDLDGDGEAELVTDWSTTITEAGAGGRVVQVLGADLKPKLELEVHDPRLMGLNQSLFGQLRLQRDSKQLIHETIADAACPPEAPAPPNPDPSSEWGATLCFSSKRTTWNKLVVASTEPFEATADGKLIVGWYHPEGRSALSAARMHVLVWNGSSYEWLTEPRVSPRWLSGVFAADASRAHWVEWTDVAR